MGIIAYVTAVSQWQCDGAQSSVRDTSAWSSSLARSAWILNLQLPRDGGRRRGGRLMESPPVPLAPVSPQRVARAGSRGDAKKDPRQFTSDSKLAAAHGHEAREGRVRDSHRDHHRRKTKREPRVASGSAWSGLATALDGHLTTPASRPEPYWVMDPQVAARRPVQLHRHEERAAALAERRAKRRAVEQGAGSPPQPSRTATLVRVSSSLAALPALPSPTAHEPRLEAHAPQPAAELPLRPIPESQQCAPGREQKVAALAARQAAARHADSLRRDAELRRRAADSRVEIDQALGALLSDEGGESSPAAAGRALIRALDREKRAQNQAARRRDSGKDHCDVY